MTKGGKHTRPQAPDAAAEGSPAAEGRRALLPGRDCRAFMEAVTESALLLDTQGTIRSCNAVAARRLGLEYPEDAEGRSLYELLPSEQAALRRERVAEVVEGRVPVRFEDEVHGRFLSHSMAPVLDDDGTVTGIAQFSQDFTISVRLDERLRREQQRQIFLMESLPGFVYVLGPDHSIRYANRAFKRYFGAHGNRPCHTVIRGRDGPCRVCPPFESLHRQERVSAEWTNQEDGKTFQIHCHPMTDVDGEVVVIVLGVDITARKQAEEELRQAHDELEQRVERRTAELRESEARFRAVVEDQTELICRLDAEGRVEFANTAYCRFFGVEREELRGRPMDMDVLEEDEPLFRSLFRGLRPEEPVHAGEFRVVVPSGESLRMGWLRWTIRGLFDGQGALQGYQAVGRDVTGRKAAEQRYHDLIQSLPVVVFALDQDLSLDFLNSTSQELLGYAPEEALDRPGWLLERVAAEDREQVRDFLEQAMAPGSDPESLEFRFEHSKGYRVHLLASPIPQSRLRNGGEPRVEGILMDVSDRSFLDKVLVQREKLNTLGAMSAELAHEIRNPLMSLGGYARRLQTKHPELPEAAIVLEEAERLEQLLERISEYLKPMRVERVPCQVNAILRFCMDHLVGHLGRRGVSTNLDLEQELSPVPADPDLLTQVFISLVTSLSDRMDRDGLLTVRTYETRQNVGVDFVVRPKTFPIANPELLFLPFEEEKDAFNLALSYRLMKNIGGFLSYEDADEAHVFTVSLPKEPMAE